MPNILFHLQFPTPLIPPTFLFDSFLDSIDGFRALKTGSGAQTWITGGLRITSGATQFSYAQLLKRSYYVYDILSWDMKRTLIAEANIRVANDSGATVYIATGDFAGAGDAFGFFFRYNKIQGFSNKGFNTTWLDLETGKSPPWEEDRWLKAIFTPGSKVEFYLEETKIGEITTNLPTGSGGAWDVFIAHAQNSLALEHFIDLSRIKVEQEL